MELRVESIECEFLFEGPLGQNHKRTKWTTFRANLTSLEIYGC